MPSVLSRELFIRALKLHPVLTPLFREGTHAKYHYMICGVQGQYNMTMLSDAKI